MQFILGLLVVGYCFSVSFGQNCSIPPLVLPLQNTTFADGIAVNRGIQLLLGGQLMGLRPSLIQNNTRVRNERDCPNDEVGFSKCQGESGGVYIIKDTFKAVPPSKWNVTRLDQHPQDATITFGYDVAEFEGTSAVIPQLPIEIWSNANAANKSELALGPSSSFLSQLVEHSWAATRNFGLYYGSRSQNRGHDGQLTIGGIDTARFNASTLAEFPMSGYGAATECPLQVMIADVVLTNSEGNFSLFRDPGARVPACVDTIQNAFTFTKTMFDEWARLTRHIDFDGSNYTSQTYPADRETFLGSLTIKLANGYTSTIPHYELVSNERGPDSRGKYTVTNSSRVMAAVQTGQGDLGVDIPLLGGVFLSQNYLRVDYDQGKFWLAQAYTSPSITSKVSSICTASSSTTSGSPPGSSGSNSDLGLKVGLPVAFVVVALCVFGWWLFKHHAKPPKNDDDGRITHFRSAFTFSGTRRAATVGRNDWVGSAPGRKRSELETTEKPSQLHAVGKGYEEVDSRRVSELHNDGVVAELETPMSSPRL